MRLRIASDLHMEFFREVPTPALEYHFLPRDERDAESILVLAGDISSIPGQLLDFLYSVEQRFAHVFYVPGNHEYYRHQMQEWNRAASGWADGMKRTTIAAGEVKTKALDGVTFVCGTLWGSGGSTKEERLNVARGLADFHVIRWASRVFKPEDMGDLNKRQQSEILTALRKSTGPSVVVTHHLPSFSLCHPRFGSAINGGFASECDHLMLGEHAPLLWVHGHTHDTMDTIVGRSRVICNPAGYRPEWGTPFNDYFAKPKFYDAPSSAYSPPT